ncbi:MAG TPA: ATP phosphoribosyltransferase, partial [Allosphingosinicella sp.]
MLVDETRLHIAVQKSGRLSDYSRALLRDAGLRIQNGRNELTARVENFPADLMFVRDDDIPTFVSDGVCEYGLVGENVLREFALGEAEPRFEVVASLGFGRCTLKLAAPEATAWEGPRSLDGARIATSYPRIVQAWLDERGVSANVVKMNGAVELAPRLGIAGFVCDLVSTGATLEANGLRARETVFDSEAVLIRTRKPVADAKREQGERLLSRIEGVLATKESKYIMLNAPGEALRQITKILPGAEAP